MTTRHWKDYLARRIMFLFCSIFLSLGFFMIFMLYQRSKPIFALIPLQDLLFSSNWHPTRGEFGLASFITGTLWVTIIAIAMAVPLSVLTAIYLAEYAPRTLREFLKPLIDLLAGISPVIYGVWGMIAVVPWVRDSLMPFVTERLPSVFPFRSENYTGFSALAGGIVLAIMTFPMIIALVGEVLQGVPFGIKESSLALGATHWQAIKGAVLKRAWPGIIAAIILGLSRALGETMAVLMVAGCSLGNFPKSIFDSAYPLPALIANTYGEMMSVPLYDAAILSAAFILLIVTLLFNMAGWGILLRMERSQL